MCRKVLEKTMGGKVGGGGRPLDAAHAVDHVIWLGVRRSGARTRGRADGQAAAAATHAFAPPLLSAPIQDLNYRLERDEHSPPSRDRSPTPGQPPPVKVRKSSSRLAAARRGSKPPRSRGSSLAEVSEATDAAGPSLGEGSESSVPRAATPASDPEGVSFTRSAPDADRRRRGPNACAAARFEFAPSLSLGACFRGGASAHHARGPSSGPLLAATTAGGWGGSTHGGAGSGFAAGAHKRAAECGRTSAGTGWPGRAWRTWRPSWGSRC